MLLSVATLADTTTNSYCATQKVAQIKSDSISKKHSDSQGASLHKALTPITADQLLRDVVTQLPSKPITVSGKLLVRRRRGVPVANYLFELKADWGKRPARAIYRINDNFGSPLEQLTIIHGAKNSYQYSSGDPLQPSVLKSLSAPIQKTDLTWTDITLSFLWWTGGKIVGEESIRTFDCYIIEVNAPKNSESTYASVKIWISKKSHLMLKAEGFDTKNKLARRLWIKSCKKIKDEWMIKDMEIQQYPKKQITKLRVLNISKTEPSPPNELAPLPTPHVPNELVSLERKIQKKDSPKTTSNSPSPYGQSLVVAPPQNPTRPSQPLRSEEPLPPEPLNPEPKNPRTLNL